MFTVTKRYTDLPAAHRQPTHQGHCALVHGHNWAFDIDFQCDTLDSNGFVVDVGNLKTVKDCLIRHFDHTLLINHNDPSLPLFIKMDQDGLVRVVIVDNCGMEALAKFVFGRVDVICSAFEHEGTPRGLRVTKVTCYEDSKNSATYTP